MNHRINFYSWEWERNQREPRRVVQCPDCGGMRMAGTGPHSPRLEAGKRLDCVGREVTP